MAAPQPGAPPPASSAARDPSKPEFDITTPEARFAEGATAELLLTVVPTGGWHLSTEYPTRIDQFTSNGTVRAVKAGFRNEPGSTPEIALTEARLSLAVPVLGERRGTDQVKARARFALCSADTCIPVERTLAWSVSVGEPGTAPK